MTFGEGMMDSRPRLHEGRLYAGETGGAFLRMSSSGGLAEGGEALWHGDFDEVDGVAV